MFLFLRPKYIKQGKLYIREAQKRVHYNRDIWSEATVAEFDAQIAKLKHALKMRNKAVAAEVEQQLEQLCAVHCPMGKDAWLSENTEVILVAIIVALGIRTFFLQPFTIPTSSMFPSLSGITGKMTEQEPPNIAVQALQFATHGRTWHNVVAKADETITEFGEAKRGGLRRIFTYTRIATDKGNEYFVNETSAPVADIWGGGRRASMNGRAMPTMVGMSFKAGEPIVRGYTDTGDHVFVDKFSYHFRKPSRGEVFVFNTQDIKGLGDAGPPPRKPSQFYIKRLTAIPGDRIQIRSPEFYVNGAKATEFGMQRVMEGDVGKPVNGGYQGYAQGPSGYDPYNLSSPADEYQIPDRRYFAMGDNSYNSQDSRYFGSVPQENLMGTGFLVYWPFLRDENTHFGVIR